MYTIFSVHAKDFGMRLCTEMKKHENVLEYITPIPTSVVCPNDTSFYVCASISFIIKDLKCIL
jgi:hypothetical protein